MAAQRETGVLQREKMVAQREDAAAAQHILVDYRQNGAERGEKVWFLH